MLLEEYDEEKVKQYLRREAMEIGHEEGLKQGREEGREQGRTQTLVELVQAGKLSLSDAASCANMSEEAFQKLLDGSV